MHAELTLFSEDLENVSALDFAKKADPTGKRTVGVLTKADLLADATTRQSKLDLLAGKETRHPLRLGYFITRQRLSAEMAANMSYEEARAKEERLFSQAPWAERDESVKKRMGIKHLTDALSVLLSELIRRS
jgi:hypothetical protein